MTALGKKYEVDVDGPVGKVVIMKRIEQVESFLSRNMKRGRKLLSAVVFKNSRVEEVHMHPYRDADTETKRELTVEKPEVAVEVPPPEKPKAAVTVAQPTIGCPVPEFERADVRATRVLREFLTPEQLADFERTQSFLVVGGDTGDTYILTSRQASGERLAKVGGRSVFNATKRYAVCVHDWTVPASEELLELKLFLELPRRETYATGLPAHVANGHI